MDVPEVEVRLEEVRLERNRPFVERLRLDHLVVGVVDVGEIDERRHQLRVALERLAVERRRLIERRVVPIVEHRGLTEELLGLLRVARGRLEPQRLRRARLQRDDLCRGGVEPEVEGKLSEA